MFGSLYICLNACVYACCADCEVWVPSSGCVAIAVMCNVAGHGCTSAERRCELDLGWTDENSSRLEPNIESEMLLCTYLFWVYSAEICASKSEEAPQAGDAERAETLLGYVVNA